VEAGNAESSQLRPGVTGQASGWYRHITLAIFAYAFLAAMAAAAIERGAEETIPVPSRPSPWLTSGDSWQLAIPGQQPNGTAAFTP
jgi:hypothetical protein